MSCVCTEGSWEPLDQYGSSLQWSFPSRGRFTANLGEVRSALLQKKASPKKFSLYFFCLKLKCKWNSRLSPSPPYFSSLELREPACFWYSKLGFIGSYIRVLEYWFIVIVLSLNTSEVMKTNTNCKKISFITCQ